MLQTRLTETLGCRYPIVQTAMGWVADPNLVAGSCNAGAFGFLAGATIPADEIERDILRVKSLTDRPFGVNFHMYQPNAADIVDLVIRHGVRAVSYSRSPGPEFIGRLKEAGVVCMPTVGLPKHAIKAVELGADIVKADPCDDVSEYHRVIEIAQGIPVLVRGGGKVSDEEILGRTKALMDQGAKGIVYGRNVIHHANPAAMTRALMAVVHDGANVKDALAMIP